MSCIGVIMITLPFALQIVFINTLTLKAYPTIKPVFEFKLKFAYFWLKELKPSVNTTITTGLYELYNYK